MERWRHEADPELPVDVGWHEVGLLDEFAAYNIFVLFSFTDIFYPSLRFLGSSLIREPKRILLADP